MIDYVGHHLKGLTICNATEVNLQRKHSNKWLKVIFWTLEKG
jgi:hypothetical protein